MSLFTDAAKCASACQQVRLRTEQDKQQFEDLTRQIASARREVIIRKKIVVVAFAVATCATVAGLILGSYVVALLAVVAVAGVVGYFANRKIEQLQRQIVADIYRQNHLGIRFNQSVGVYDFVKRTRYSFLDPSHISDSSIKMRSFLNIAKAFIQMNMVQMFKGKHHGTSMTMGLSHARKVDLPRGADVYVIGDVNGDVKLLREHWEKLRRMQFLNKQGLLKENKYVVFLGDSVDLLMEIEMQRFDMEETQQEEHRKAYNGMATLTALMFKQLYNPNKVFFVRGAHDELPGYLAWTEAGDGHEIEDLHKIHDEVMHCIPEILFMRKADGEMLTFSHGVIDPGYYPDGFLSSEAGFHWFENNRQRFVHANRALGDSMDEGLLQRKDCETAGNCLGPVPEDCDATWVSKEIVSAKLSEMERIENVALKMFVSPVVFAGSGVDDKGMSWADDGDGRRLLYRIAGCTAAHLGVNYIDSQRLDLT